MARGVDRTKIPKQIARLRARDYDYYEAGHHYSDLLRVGVIKYKILSIERRSWLLFAHLECGHEVIINRHELGLLPVRGKATMICPYCRDAILGVK